MVRGRDWDKHNRDSRASRSRFSDRGGPRLREVFEALSYYQSERMHEGGNFVVLPGRWRTMTDAELQGFRLAHRTRNCAQNKEWFDYARGDRLVRIENQTVEALALRNCEICASFVRRN
jgi:hypothetical protein